MKLEKVKVWWQKLDAEGNVLEQGCDDREYINYGCAINRAEKLFGKSRYWRPSISNETADKVEPRIRWRISHRDPWVEYFEEIACDVCGAVHKRKHNEYGGDMANYFWMSGSKDDLDYKYRRRSRICQSCAGKLVEFIKELEKGGADAK